MKGKVAFVTIGCKVNQCESASLAEMFSRSGWQVAPKEEADVFVVNTCTVTAEAERKCRQQIRKLAKTNPEARIVVMGCYAQVAPEEVKLPGVQFIVGTHRRAEI
ncbi:MAG: tRNA (N(6)-L-threonylcarbamoyladenosine(37)-C(2))-methylthiotransferase MtaB, partial [Firmicutes bacterium]|nr:tRNA (N(6)-L-threonylcarbamoyladenosine(37)-C(2))-methylthiotransferase MtaB [Bacillota bacterium]